MIDTQQHRPAARRRGGRRRRTRCGATRAVPSGESSHSLPNLPGQARKRRNTLMIVKKLKQAHKNEAHVCLVSTENNGNQSHTDPGEEPQRSVVIQQPQSSLIVPRIACHKTARRKTVLRDLQGSQSQPLLALLFLRSSHSKSISSETANVQLLFVQRQLWLVL